MIETIEDIDKAILELEEQKVIEELALKKQLEITFEKIHPINFLKNTIEELQKSNEIKEQLAQLTIAYTSNVLSKKIKEATIQNPLYKIAAFTILNKCTQLASDNPQWIVASGVILMRNLVPSKTKNHD